MRELYEMKDKETSCIRIITQLPTSAHFSPSNALVAIETIEVDLVADLEADANFISRQL